MAGGVGVAVIVDCWASVGTKMMVALHDEVVQLEPA